MINAKYLHFSEDPDSRILIDWWKGLENNRGDRSALRRCQRLMEVAFIPSYHRLLRQISSYGNIDYDGLAMVAGLAAHVKSHNEPYNIAEQMAQPKTAGGSAKVSGLRFRRLLKIQNREELYPALVRIVALLGGSLNLLSLADSAYWWNDRTKKEWAFDYYSNAPSEA